MRFERLLQNVQRAEQRVELRAVKTQLHWASLKQSWRDGWTPGRILVAGLVSGFLVGRAEPMRALTGARWMQMFTAVSSLLASSKAATAAQQAEQAADTAQDVQAEATGEAFTDTVVVDSAAATDPMDEHIVVTAPRPAEAATELSER